MPLKIPIFIDTATGAKYKNAFGVVEKIVIRPGDYIQPRLFIYSSKAMSKIKDPKFISKIHPYVKKDDGENAWLELMEHRSDDLCEKYLINHLPGREVCGLDKAVQIEE